jgi:hypothetical protein
VQAVGTAARFREIWHAAHQCVQTFRETGQARNVGQQRRADLEDLVDELGNLELDLSFSVETPADLGLLIPSLRIESFHRQLYRVMELPARAKTVSQMFDRLEEKKRLRGAIAVSMLSVIGVPLGFIVAFFGINAVQVDSNLSIFDLSHYLGAYIVAILLGLIPIVVFLALHGKAWLRAREDARRRTPTAGKPLTPHARRDGAGRRTDRVTAVAGPPVMPSPNVLTSRR